MVQWPQYREMLLPIIQQTECRNRHQFSAEVDSALSDERAFLFMAEDGFMVLQPIPEQGGIISVNIMFAYNDGGDASIRYQSMIEQLTREIGGRSVHFYTKVAGLRPIAESLGYKLDKSENSVLKFRKIL